MTNREAPSKPYKGRQRIKGKVSTGILKTPYRLDMKLIRGKKLIYSFAYFLSGRNCRFFFTKAIDIRNITCYNISKR